MSVSDGHKFLVLKAVWVVMTLIWYAVIYRLFTVLILLGK